MYYLGKFFHPRKKLAFYGHYDREENLVYPIESIFYPNKTGSPFNFNQLHPLLCIEPRKIIGIGKNYKSHIKEFKSEIPSEPIIFLKSPESIIGPEERIILPNDVGQVDYEGEIAVVIKKEAENVSEEKALDYVLGYTCANDITARELQKKDGQWTRAKGFKTFCPVGPWILPATEFPKFQNLTLKTYVNDKPVQFAKASSMVFNIPYLISFVTRVMTLYPGDIILTGTPSGVGPIKRNYKVAVEIEEIGTLINRVGGELSIPKQATTATKSV
ncbi:MAG: fumarylacetoacetate hydrolase family protein [Candidatus Melainabacteria bacterium]|nr:fumarylacetoacetate hydrolase family protein [Candidatus Melainabacteria bacterium]